MRNQNNFKETLKVGKNRSEASNFRNSKLLKSFDKASFNELQLYLA